MSKQWNRVAVLLGGSTPEREVSLDSGAMTAEALEGLCAEVVRFDPQSQQLGELAALEPDAVFVMLHGGAGEDGRVQAVLELQGLPYTGSGPHACTLAMDKRASLAIWKEAGLPTGAWRTVGASASERDLERIGSELGYPLFVKPNSGGSSLASGKASDAAQLRERIDEALADDSLALIEPHFAGAELTYGILDGKALPGIQIEAQEGFYDYEAKYASEATRYLCPPPIAKERERQLRKLAESAFALLGCRSWGRIDLLADDSGCKLLEANTVPGMTSHSLVPKAAAAMGIDYVQLVRTILEDAQC